MQESVLQRFNQKFNTELFLFIKASTVSWLTEDLNLFTVNPALENILSAGTEVAGMDKSECATFAIRR